MDIFHKKQIPLPLVYEKSTQTEHHISLVHSTKIKNKNEKRARDFLAFQTVIL